MSDHAASRSKLAGPYLWTITATGGLALLYSLHRLNPSKLDSYLIVLFGMAVISSWIIVPIPRFSSQVSVSDTFVFLILLLYGGDAAVIVASTVAVLSSARFSRKVGTITFNCGCAALSVFLTATVLQFLFGDPLSLHTRLMSARYLAAICTMALLQYAANSGLVAIGAALKANQPIWQTWRSHYLWTSITYFAGASAASVIAGLVHQIGLYAFIIALPIVAIVFLTYRTYLKNVETAAAQADQAEEHVKELSHYIAEQERIREQFSQIEKLSALGELASGVAHDFNNTLAGILGRAQLLQRTNDPEKLRRGLEIIIKTAEDGARTVKRIQDFARQRRDHDFTLISVDHILQDVSEITRPRWKDYAEASNIHINLNLRISSNSMVKGDDSELREVLVNMVLNAVDAMPQGGTLSLATRNTGDSVVITVADNGFGMYPEVRSRIFDPFFTTKGKAGLGLGLAVSFGIIRRHGGTIDVDSTYGTGTEFRITLPVASVVSHAGSAESSEASNWSEECESIAEDQLQTRLLVVDDEDFVRDLLKEILETEGCRVSLATCGAEAIDLFDKNRFDGVFTDIGMPGMSGWELAAEIRKRNPVIPIAVVTGWGEAVGSHEQRAAGVDWVVAKPFTADRICAVVRDIKGQRSFNDFHTSEPIVAAQNL
jgi:signal transduction histidine kinase/ActR/RegA family two-component response regulator